MVRLVKLWARQKNIYSTNLCFLNGVTIQIMVLLVMEIVYDESFNINRQALNLITHDGKARKVLTSMLKLNSPTAQVEYVLEKFFEIYSAIFTFPGKRWFSHEQGLYNFQLCHSFRKS